MKKFYLLNIVFMVLLASLSRVGMAIEPPYLGPIPNQTALVGQEFTLDIDALNADPAETYELVTAPDGMEIDPVTGVITWVPARIDAGGEVTVRAYNIAGGYERTFLIYLSNAITCPPSLLSYWKLDTIAGDSAYPDYSGGLDAMTPYPLPGVEGIVDSGRVFTPVNKLTRYLEVPDSTAHTWTRNESFSFSFWFNYQGDTLNQDQMILTKGAFNQGISCILIGLDNSGDTSKLSFQVKTKNAISTNIAKLNGSTGILEDQWYHVTAVYQGAAFPDPVTLRLYVDGAKDSLTYAGFDETGFTSKKNLAIGYWDAFGSNKYPFNGYLDEISLFNKALTDAEVADMQTNALAGLPICRPGNYAPLILSSPTTTGTQGEQYTDTIRAVDYENDPLTMWADSIPSWLSFDGSTGILSGTPDNANVGDSIVDIVVSDGEIEIHQVFTLSIANVNDPPVITSVPEDTVLYQGDTINYKFTAMDIDQGDAVTLKSVVLPSWMTFDPATGILSGVATNDQVLYAADSTFLVKLEAVDKSDSATDQEFTVRVINVNDPPQVIDQQTIHTDRNIPVIVSLSDLTIVDPDNPLSDITMKMFDGDHYSVSGNTIIPDKNYYGELLVDSRIMDKADTVDYTISITVDFVNIVPAFTSEPVTSATEGKAYSYLVVATDADVSDPGQDQSLTFWTEDLPLWLTFNPTNNVLVGVPANADVGENAVKIGVTDGIDTVFQDFTITVENVNDAPVISGQNDISGRKNGYVVITTDDLIITDPDNVPADMTVSVLDGSGYTFNGDTVFFPQDFLGTIDANVKVNDGLDDSNSFQIEILVEPGVGIPSLSGDLINRVYPNPAGDYVIFDLKSKASHYLEIRDLSGKVLIQRKLEAGDAEYRINISDLSSGVYLYSVYNGQHYQTGKLMVE